MRSLVLASTFLALAAVACSEDSDSGSVPIGNPDAAVDAGVTAPDAAPDAEVVPPDAGFPDAGPPPDVGVRFSEFSCLSCGDGCPAALCRNEFVNRDPFCADRCDDDLDGCIDGYSCIQIGNRGAFCVPPDATCGRVGSDFGGRCFDSIDTCPPAMTFCEGDTVGVGFCTRECGSGCPPNYACLAGDDGVQVCKPAFAAAAEQCARGYDPAELPCAVDTDCDALEGSRCVRTSPAHPGVCALACEGDEACPTGRCLATERGPRCLTDRCACHATPDPSAGRDLVGEALEAVGLNRCDAIFSLHDWASEAPDLALDPYRLSFFDPVHNQPLSAPAFGEALVSDLEARATLGAPAEVAARMVERLAVLADQPATETIPDPLDASEPLVAAMAELIRTAGGVPDLAALRVDAADLPGDLRTALAQVVDALRRATILRAQALDTRLVSPQGLWEYGPAFVVRRADRLGLPPGDPNVRDLLNDVFGYAQMYGSAVAILDAIAAANFAAFAQPPATETAAEAPFLFNQPTPIGRVVVAGPESHLYRPDLANQDGAWALLVDLGGNDEYRIPAGGNISAANLASVAIDLGGRDLYAYVEVPADGDEGRLPSDEGGRAAPDAAGNGPLSLSQVPRQGGGRVGTGILVDLGLDDDVYRSLRMSQGAGVFGTGVLIDEGGNDRYEGEAFVQGVGAFGIGLLLDFDGRDVRRAYQMAQGFAYARAVGLVFDAGGNDDYFMDPGDPAVGGDPLYASGQRPGRANTSLGQGFGFGRRADLGNNPDRAFMSGGVGMIVDQAGDDTYTSSIFAQGGGFWFGTGIVADREGDDVYDALWYAMGTGAHYALGLLLEGGGDDSYGGTLPRVNVTVAGAHDYTVAFLIDSDGNDDYRGSRISLGSGNVNGFGVFVDARGDDRYDVRSNYAIGSAGLLESGPSNPGAARRKVDSVGIFIDAQGLDTYSLNDEATMPYTNDATWLQTNNPDPAVALTELGVGIDATEGNIVFSP